MSVAERTFLKVFGSIAGILIAAMILGMFSVFSSFDVIEENVLHNEKEIEKTVQFHKEDVGLIRTYMGEIRVDQKIIKQDIKEILKNSNN